jgi:2-dehydro-3-deoxy-L-rhamnonate dehydrogenase (NAD+)
VTSSYDFSGRTAVVTGGAGGIGRAVADRLGQAGARVWIWDLADTEPGTDRMSTVDITDPDQIAAELAHVLAHSTAIDILVNSAGCLGDYVPFERLSPAAYRRVVDVNLVGVLEVCRQVLPHLRRAERGRIVNLGSLAGKHGLANLSAYSAASAGVIAFTKALAQELADTEIRVNSVAPGPIATTLIESLGPEVVASMIASSPLRRLGTTDEVADLVIWLCSDACSFTTGAVFDVSGGRAAY